MADTLFSDGGWAEVLFRRDPRLPFRNIADIKEEHYMQVGSPVPLRELTMLYDLVLMLKSGNYDVIPRPFQHGDVLQIVTGPPQPVTHTYLTVDVNLMKTQMEPGKYRVEILPGNTLGLIKIPMAFSSFWMRGSLQT